MIFEYLQETLILIQNKMFRKTIILDINLMPFEYTELTLKEGVKEYEKDFNVKIIPIDPSRSNTQGNNSSPIIIIL